MVGINRHPAIGEFWLSNKLCCKTPVMNMFVGLPKFSNSGMPFIPTIIGSLILKFIKVD